MIHIVYQLSTSPHLKDLLGIEIRDFWYRGITGASKPEHFIFGGKWYIRDLPDPREELGNDPLLCVIAASTAEQLVEAYNWGIGQGIRTVSSPCVPRATLFHSGENEVLGFGGTGYSTIPEVSNFDAQEVF